MMIKQRAIKIYYNNNRCWGYDDLVNALNIGWVVKRADPLYDCLGNAVSNVYILEKEVDKQSD
jgi:hypothetical protein